MTFYWIVIFVYKFDFKAYFYYNVFVYYLKGVNKKNSEERTTVLCIKEGSMSVGEFESKGILQDIYI